LKNDAENVGAEVQSSPSLFCFGVSLSVSGSFDGRVGGIEWTSYGYGSAVAVAGFASQQSSVQH
jgi:hypothetical protein